MKTYKKNFVGKGTQVENLPIAKCTVKVSELLRFVHQYNGEDYVSFEVAKMKQPDQFGRDYTVYCTTEEQAEEEKPAEKKRKSRKAETADLAF
jgi:hypothetical protein